MRGLTNTATLGRAPNRQSGIYRLICLGRGRNIASRSAKTLERKKRLRQAFSAGALKNIGFLVEVRGRFVVLG